MWRGCAVPATPVRPDPAGQHAMAIHPTAIVEPGAQLGEGVEVGPWCIVGSQVRLGDRTRLHAHVVVEGDTWLGEDCEVFPFAVLGAYPQDKKLRQGEPGGMLRIGARNRIREHVTIHGGTSFGGGITRVGNDNMLLVGCHIGHDATVGDRTVFTNGAMAAGHTWIGDAAIIGAMVGIHQFARVGTMAMLGAGSKVSSDVPPCATVQGDRARLVGVNTVGLQRNAVSPGDAAAVKRAFRQLFWGEGPMADRIATLLATPLGTVTLVRQICEFVASSERGVCMPRNGRSHPAGGGENETDAET